MVKLRSSQNNLNSLLILAKVHRIDNARAVSMYISKCSCLLLVMFTEYGGFNADPQSQQLDGASWNAFS